MSTLGSIVVDELIVPITEVYLEGGEVCIRAIVRGPVRAVDTVRYTVHGRDGGQVWRGRRPVRWSRQRVGSTVQVTVTLAVVDKLGESERR